jgi:hypothetical protein
MTKSKQRIHYATGGFIPGEALQKKGQNPEFHTLCGRTYDHGGSDLMQSGYLGAQHVTCKQCRQKLDIQERKRMQREQIERDAQKKIANLYK